MKPSELLLVAVALCGALVACAEAKRFVPLPNATCPQRKIGTIFLFDEFIEDYMSEGTLMSLEALYYSLELASELDWAPWDYGYGYEGRDTPPEFDGDSWDSPYELREYLSEYAERIASDWDYENVSTIVVIRGHIDDADQYMDAALSAQANGVRIITVDVNCTKAQAMATMTASEPRERNALVFNQGVLDTLEHVPVLSQAVREDLGRRCVVSDRMTVHTFDGAAFKHSGVGDYVLFRQYPLLEPSGDLIVSDMEVQVRKTECGNIVQKVVDKQACISAVAVRWTGFDFFGGGPSSPSTSTLTISYDRDLNDVIVAINGTVLPPESLARYFMFDRNIQRVEPDVGLHMGLSFLENSYMFFGPFLAFTPKITIDFFKDEARDPVIIIDGDMFAWTRSTGMCGTYDSCVFNEFVTADGKMVSGANESAPTWRVHGGESLFEQAQYFAAASGESVLSLHQPLIPASWEGENKGETLEDSGLSELNNDVLFAVCDEYCRFGRSGVAVIDRVTKEENPCNAYCDEQAVDLDGLANFDLFAEYNDTNLPNVTVGMHTDGRHVKLHAPMGGRYVFAVRAADCCGEGADANVTVNVRCANSLAITIENKDALNFPYNNFPMPRVQLAAKLSGDGADEAHVMWRVVSFPNNTRMWYEYTSAPTLRYANTLTPELLPTHVGNYTIEVVAFDGCNLVSDTVYVFIQCVDSGSSAWVVTFEGGSSKWSGSSFNSVEIMAALSCPLYTPMFIFYNEVHFDYELTLPAPQDPMLKLEFYDEAGDGEWKEYYLYWHTETPVTTNVTVETVDVTDTDLIGSWGPIPSANGINRIEGQYRKDEYFVTGSEETTTVVHEYSYIHMRECYFEVDSDYEEFSNNIDFDLSVSRRTGLINSWDLPEWANTTDIRRVADLNAPFNFGVCAGLYHFNSSVGTTAECNNKTVEHDWHVTCDDGWVGPYSKPIWPCFPTVYDYDAQEFPQVLLNGLDSGDRKSRTLEYRWVTKSLPEGATDPITGHYQSSTTLDVSPNVEGEYTFELAVSNGCRVDREETTVAAECAGEVNAVATCPPATIVFNYTDTDENGFELVGTLSSTTATLASGDIAPLTFRWDGAGPLGSATWNTENVTVPGVGIIGGVYSANLTVTDGCRTDTASCMLTVTCPNVLTAHASVNLTTAALNPITGDSEPIAAFDLSTSNEAHFVQWMLYYDVLGNGSYTQDVWGSANNNFNITFTVDVAGDYKLVLTATDMCMVSTDEVFFSATCGTSNVMSPFIQMTNAGGSVIYIENATVFTADSAASSAGEWEGATVPFTRAWRLVWPDGTVETGTAVQFSSSTGLIPGEYNLTLTITDQCKSASRDMNLHVLCARQVNPVAHASAATVTWMGNKFPIVSLDGDNSVVHEMARSSATYVWTFLDAPEASVFKGRDNVYVETRVTNTTSPTGEWVDTLTNGVHHNVSTWKQVLHTEVWRVVKQTRLTPDVTATPVLGACFRPDVPGRYTLEFALSSACDSEIATVSVDAVCNGAPVLAATIPSESLVWETIMLDASATADPNGDTLSYTWTVGLCNETYDYTYNMLNSLSATPLFTPTNPGNYCVTLEVSDGCSTVNGMWTIDVGCNTTVSETIAPLAHEYTVDFAGTGLQVVALEVEESETVGERSQQWLNTHGYAWTLIAYSPAEVAPAGGLSGGAIAGIVIGVLAGLALLGVGAAFLIMWLLKRKAAGGASTSSGSSTATEGAEVEMPPATV